MVHRTNRPPYRPAESELSLQEFRTAVQGPQVIRVTDPLIQLQSSGQPSIAFRLKPEATGGMRVALRLWLPPSGGR